MTSPPREYLEFFRVDQSGATKRFLFPAIFLLTIGPPLILFSAALKSFAFSHQVGVIGAMLMGAGLITGFGGIAVLLLDDRWVAVVEGGLVVNIEKKETFYPWDDLEKIHADGKAIAIVPREGDEVRIPFSKKTAVTVAARLDDWRRKAAWNLAPEGPP